MRQGLKLNLVVGLVFLAFALSPAVALATPHLTLTPTSSSIVNGTNFEVIIGVASGTETASGVDVVGTFDASKLEIVSINKSGTVFTMDSLQSLTDNTLGKFSFSAYDTSGTTVVDETLNGNLAVVIFKTKTTGTASVNFTCQTGSTIDSNIMKSTSVDIIDCSTNQSGSYTITASATTTTTPNATTTATPTVSTSTTQAELPKTGSVGTTVGLIVFGLVSVFSALFLKLL